MNPYGYPIEFFSVELTAAQLVLLGAEVKKTIIFEAELLALVLSLALRCSSFKANSLMCFVDNNAARDVATSGNGRNDTANWLIDFLLKIEMQNFIAPWYGRVLRGARTSLQVNDSF